MKIYIVTRFKQPGFKLYIRNNYKIEFSLGVTVFVS